MITNLNGDLKLPLLVLYRHLGNKYWASFAQTAFKNRIISLQVQRREAGQILDSFIA